MNTNRCWMMFILHYDVKLSSILNNCIESIWVLVTTRWNDRVTYRIRAMAKQWWFLKQFCWSDGVFNTSFTLLLAIMSYFVICNPFSSFTTVTNAVAWGGAGGARAPPIKISRRSIPPDSLKLRDFGARGGPPQ